MERGAYVASIGRAKYVLEHLPNTPQTPYALAILVKAYETLGYLDLSEENKKILELNYPDFVSYYNLNTDKRSWLNRLSFGVLDKEEVPPPSRLE